MSNAIDAYLSALPLAQRTSLQGLRTLLHSAIPNAEETVKTRVPALRYKGKTVVGFGAAVNHLALYVMFGEALHALGRDLAGFDATARVVRFTPDKPLPARLVRRIVRHRLAEIEAQTTPGRKTRTSRSE